MKNVDNFQKISIINSKNKIKEKSKIRFLKNECKNNIFNKSIDLRCSLD